MKEWERALLEHDTPDAETITQSELESVIEECDTVPTTARVVPDKGRDMSKYLEVVFMQGDDASELFDLLDSHGWDALIDRLTDWDYGQKTEDAAVINGFIYDGLPPYQSDQRFSRGKYIAVVNWPYNYIALYRELPDDWQPTI